MSTGLSIGQFELDIAVYTCAGTFYQPRGWRPEGNRHICDRLASGDGGEERVAQAGRLESASPDGETGVHEWPDKPWVDERENETFYIPTLSITKHTLQREMPGIRATIERARDYVAHFVAE